MGMQMRVFSFWCFSLNLSGDTYFEKLLCSKLCSLRLFDYHQNIFSGMTTIPFLLDFGFLVVYAYCSTMVFHWEFGKRGIVRGRTRSVTLNISLILTSQVEEEIGLIAKGVLGLCFVSAALPRVGCITKQPTMNPFSRISR